jgi:polysaccharide export outer membrane protein
MKRWLAVGAALVAAGVLTGCVQKKTKPLRSNDLITVVESGKLPPPDTTSASGAYIGVPDYRIGPLDLLEVSVFQVPDLSRTVRVNSAGEISLPMIGAVLAGGKTVGELEQAIADKLRESFLQDPQVSVFIQEFASQRVTLEGSVRNQGIKPLTGKTTLLQLIASAGGLTETADPEKIIIFRTINGKRMAALFNLIDIRSGLAEDPQVYGDDVVIVDDSRYATLAATLRGWAGFRPLVGP